MGAAVVRLPGHVAASPAGKLIQINALGHQLLRRYQL
jgi:hypothetical protein